MKVKELMTSLSRMSPDALVVLASDGEGNEFSPLHLAEPTLYEAETSYSGMIVDTDQEEDSAGMPAVVLWPAH